MLARVPADRFSRPPRTAGVPLHSAASDIKATESARNRPCDCHNEVKKPFLLSEAVRVGEVQGWRRAGCHVDFAPEGWTCFALGCFSRFYWPAWR
jgi:hypothetical protein